MYEPESLNDIIAEFPAWSPWISIDQQYHARLRYGSATVKSDSLIGLRDQIIIWIRRQLAESGPGGGCSL